MPSKKLTIAELKKRRDEAARAYKKALEQQNNRYDSLVADALKTAIKKRTVKQLFLDQLLDRYVTDEGDRQFLCEFLDIPSLSDTEAQIAHRSSANGNQNNLSVAEGSDRESEPQHQEHQHQHH